MKALLISLVLFTTVSYSQSLGWTYSNCLESIKNNTKYENYQIDNNIEKGYKLINATNISQQSSPIFTTYYFNLKTDICFQIVHTYPISKINDIIQSYNNSFVKISELKWKDYESNCYLELDKSERLCFVKFYQ